MMPDAAPLDDELLVDVVDEIAEDEVLDPPDDEPLAALPPAPAPPGPAVLVTVVPPPAAEPPPVPPVVPVKTIPVPCEPQPTVIAAEAQTARTTTGARVRAVKPSMGAIDAWNPPPVIGFK
jgi:hypothetical protein